MTYNDLILRLIQRIIAIERPHPVRIFIDGIDAAGKTTLAHDLVAPLQTSGRSVIHASIDGFHNPGSVRYRRGPDSPHGYFEDSFNIKAVQQVLLDPLGPDGNRRYRRAAFDFRTDQPVNAPVEMAEVDAILLFEGVFLLRPELRSHCDFSIFLDISFETSLRRALQRDLHIGNAAAIEERYNKRYIPGQKIYLDTCHPRDHADVIIDNNDPQNPDVIKGYLP